MTEIDHSQKPEVSINAQSQRVFARLWHGFLLTVSMQHFYRIFSPWVKWLSMIALLLFAVGSVWGLAIAPPDYLQGNSYRIIFIHVPTASLALSIYFGLAILGVISLVWKIKTATVVAQAAAPVGLVLCVLSLITGAIWGKPTWGAYWVWDGRLTSMLVLVFLYVGVVALFHTFENSTHQGKAAAILSIIGAVNLPIIKYSVVWWNTLHQGSTFSLTALPQMPSSMYLPLAVMIFGFYFLVVALVIYRSCTLILVRERQKTWVKELIAVRGKR